MTDHLSGGYLVRFVPSNADTERAQFGGNVNPSGVLDPARTYRVERVEVHSWHTKLWLTEAGGPYNGAHFVRAEGNEP